MRGEHTARVGNSRTAHRIRESNCKRSCERTRRSCNRKVTANTSVGLVLSNPRVSSCVPPRGISRLPPGQTAVVRVLSPTGSEVCLASSVTDHSSCRFLTAKREGYRLSVMFLNE